MKEMVINPDNVLDEDVNEIVYIYNLLFINNNELIVNKHHNTYFFIHEYDKESIKEKYGIDINLYEPFLIKKKYVSDYPLFGNNILYVNKYYKIGKNLDVSDFEYIPLDNAKNILEESKYNNPRNQDITDEIIELLEYL